MTATLCPRSYSATLRRGPRAAGRRRGRSGAPSPCSSRSCSLSFSAPLGWTGSTWAAATPGIYRNTTLAFAVIHCKEILIYVFPEKELRGLSPSFHIHVSVSDLYITMFGPPIFLQQNRQTHQRNTYIAHRNMNVGIGTVAPRSSFPGIICFEFSVMYLCLVQSPRANTSVKLLEFIVRYVHIRM